MLQQGRQELACRVNDIAAVRGAAKSFSIAMRFGVGTDCRIDILRLHAFATETPLPPLAAAVLPERIREDLARPLRAPYRSEPPTSQPDEPE
jgi:hypothetical protein